MPSTRMIITVFVIAVITIAIVFRSPLRGPVVGS
jgi:hypothetical protein